MWDAILRIVEGGRRGEGMEKGSVCTAEAY
jgi:hypothetical protein